MYGQMGSGDEKNERVRLRSFVWGYALTAPHTKISSNEAPQTKIFSVRFLVNPFARGGGCKKCPAKIAIKPKKCQKDNSTNWWSKYMGKSLYGQLPTKMQKWQSAKSKKTTSYRSWQSAKRHHLLQRWCPTFWLVFWKNELIFFFFNLRFLRIAHT